MEKGGDERRGGEWEKGAHGRCDNLRDRCGVAGGGCPRIIWISELPSGHPSAPWETETRGPGHGGQESPHPHCQPSWGSCGPSTLPLLKVLWRIWAPGKGQQ